MRRTWAGGRYDRIYGRNVAILNPVIFTSLVDMGLELSTFVCPSRGTDYPYVRSSGSGNIPITFPLDPKASWYRISFNNFIGIDQAAIAAKATSLPEWVSPMSMEDPGDLPANACILERGAASTGTSYPHGPKGLEGDPTNWANIKQEDTGSQGTNVTANDGSTQFVPAAETIEFNAHLSGSPIGYWNYVDSYDAKNPGYTGS